MRIKLVVAVVVVGLCAAVLVVLLRPQAQVYVTHYENVLGTSLELRLLARTPAAAEQAETAVIAELRREADILSAYDPASEFSRWTSNVGVPTQVSPELFDVLRLFDTWRGRTGGALDAAAETVSRVWTSAAAAGRTPTAAELVTATTLVRQQHWQLDPQHRTATHTSRAPLVLNSFTKSFIVDRAARRALATNGVDGVLVNVGGDLVVRGNWSQSVSLTNPKDNADNAAPLVHLQVRDRAIATSGGYRRGFDIAGRHYSHIVDPRSGRPAGHVLSATVVAADAVDAGALATAFCVLTPEQSAALARTVHDAEFLLVLADGRRVASQGWHRLVTPSPSSAPSVALGAVYAAEPSPWPQGFELEIALELNRANGFGRRPYVAVWLEDKDHFPLRTVNVWFDKYRYLNELRAWYKSDRLRAVTEGRELIDSVSSATRAPGKYTLKWDGKDNQGKYVAAGNYTVFIEATREHGTYQLIRQDMAFTDMPKHVDLPGGTEISAASLDYHKSGSR
jgi:thiamine biosynthesis lipoprotein ApbE